MQALLTASPWFWIALLVMAADWIATGFQAKAVRYITKPAALIALIIWFSVLGGWRGALVWFGLGLVFSLLGDIFLLKPERAFILGLAAFLTGHLCYIIGFNSRPIVWNAVLLIPIIAVVVIALLVGRHVLGGINRDATNRSMKIPVIGYMAVILLMLLSAAACFFRPAWPVQAATLSTLGAASFLASDSLLASDRFVRPRSWANLAVMITYHVGQILIAAGALLAFG
ncbi:MAG TPA: lysoplasmalogenase [Longilinea sp.]|nr:lysoplasmalogenase [Longilinea sp.]